MTPDPERPTRELTGPNRRLQFSIAQMLGWTVWIAVWLGIVSWLNADTEWAIYLGVLLLAIKYDRYSTNGLRVITALALYGFIILQCLRPAVR